MDKSPLIEMAEQFEYDADLVIDLPEAANRELRNSRILRAAAAVIETTALWLRTGEGSPDAVEASLRAYEAACKEQL